MNKKQMKVFWAGIVLAVLMTLVPPWKYTYYVPGKVQIEKAGPYGFVFSPPGIPVTSRYSYGEAFEGYARRGWAVQVDWQRLFLPLGAVGMLTFALTLTFRAR